MESAFVFGDSVRVVGLLLRLLRREGRRIKSRDEGTLSFWGRPTLGLSGLVVCLLDFWNSSFWHKSYIIKGHFTHEPRAVTL